MSLSLHSSTEYLGGSNRWSRNERDIVPEKSSIGLISSKISSSPDWVGTSLRPACWAASTLAFHFSLPSSQSKDSVCSARRSGTSRGSLMRANETRFGPVAVFEALREAAKSGPSEGSRRTDDTHARRPMSGALRLLSHVDRQRAAQRGSVADCHTAGNSSAAGCITVAWQHRSSARSSQERTWTFPALTSSEEGHSLRPITVRRPLTPASDRPPFPW